MRAHAFFWLLAFGLISGSWAVADEAIALPPFLVEELAKGPPWRYTESLGFEILSRCSDRTTARVVTAHHRLHELLAEILPASLCWQTTLPRTLILYDEELQPASSQEVIRNLLRSHGSLPEEDFATGAGGRGFRLSPPPQRYSFLPNLRLWDRDAMAVFMIVRRDDFDADRLALTYDYISFLVKQRLPSLPPWFLSGFLNLYQKTTYQGDRLIVDPLEWPWPLPVEGQKQDPQSNYPVGSLSDLFQGRLVPPSPASSIDPLKLWQTQAALFVRWALHADRRAYRQGFWQFVERCSIEGASEPLFTKCFGFDHSTARQKLLAYLSTESRKTAVFRPPRSAKPPSMTFVNADDLQIARIKGDWERLEVPYVKAISNELAPKYLELARRTLKRAYDRDHRDPRLLAVMGLCECDAGNHTAAREYLETAAQIGSIRPRANYELARLRFADHQQALATSADRLSAGQSADILRPLFAARADLPPLPEVYELIAEVWSRCAVPPTRGHLAVLEEGVRLFPRRTALLFRTAELNLRHGFPEVAAPLIEIGLRLADDDSYREKLRQLQQQLPPSFPLPP